MRSSSAPAVAIAERQQVSDDGIQAFPSLPNGDVPERDIGSWVRELATSRSGRQSRASSIVSTRTRFSTNTMDEVRSIEISAGGHTFRISRDGSRVIDTTAPPPYPGSLYEASHDHDSDLDEQNSHDDTDMLQHSQQRSNVDREPRKRVRIVMPGEDDSDTETNAVRDERSPDRVLTKADLYQIMMDLPQQLKRVLGIKAPASREPLDKPNSKSKSENLSAGLEKNKGLIGKHLRRDSGVDCASSMSDASSSNMQPGPSAYGLAGLQARDLHGTIVRPDIDDSLPDSASSTETLRPISAEEGSLNVLMTMGDLNELSLLYNRVIRDLDREHRKVLHERDKEMEHLRSLLNEKDIVYRQQLRGKDFIIEDLRTRLTHQEESLEQRLEQARNQVEDTWEKRWKDRDRHLMERMKRMELELIMPLATSEEEQHEEWQGE